MSERRKAVIVDVDGTLCDVTSVRHHVLKPKGYRDYDAFHAGSLHCPPIPTVRDWVAEKHDSGHVILVVTGRKERWRELTQRWLAEHLPQPYDGPFMRSDDDNRQDAVLKSEILRYLMRHYDIRAAIDDRPEVVEMWIRHGIPVTVVPGWA